jgi:6-phosphofructokinase
MSKLLLLHGGGPTAVINASLYGAIRKARESGAFDQILAGRCGTGGVLREEFIDLSDAAEGKLALLPYTPGSAIGTGRDHLEDEDFVRMCEICQKHGITHVAMNGGNGTMDTAYRFSEAGKNFNIKVCGIPKTMDNDLSGTDHSPGFGSAGRYLAGSVKEAAQDVLGLPIHVVVIEAFGRDAGWITASSVFAREKEGDAPHLILIPEVSFDEEYFLKRVKELYEEKGGVVVVASEGLRYKDGTPIVEPVFQVGRSVYFGDVSSHLANLVIKKLGIKARSEKPGILGRASIKWVSESDRAEAIACGAKTIEALLEGKTGYMSTIERVSDNPYKVEIALTKIDSSVLEAKRMDKSFYTDDYDITNKFIDYAEPLIGGELGKYTSFMEN